jgi:hypothetical protein
MLATAGPAELTDSAPRHTCLAVVASFGGDAVGAVVGGKVGFGARMPSDGTSQFREQQCADRGGEVRCPRRGDQNQGAVGQLLFAAAPKV